MPGAALRSAIHFHIRITGQVLSAHARFFLCRKRQEDNIAHPPGSTAAGRANERGVCLHY